MNDAGRKLIELLRTTARLGTYRSVLAEVVALARQAPGLSDEQVRVRLVGVARRLDGETR
ncbi:MAG: hypothetical protein JO281_19525 [Pseudonocardiales bacterium]|nr:hypothetical protein [Pseudonocardiales bacterium]